MRGSSGARLTDHGDFVLKQDTAVTGKRVRDQGIWLHNHDQSVVLPTVRVVYHDGYELEKLTMCELPATWKETSELCDDIIDALDEQLWDRKFDTQVPRRVAVHEDLHRSYITDLLRDVNIHKTLRKTLHGFANKIYWQDLRSGRTHGDGIIDNLAYRTHSNGSIDLVLIDPIPACPALPDKVAVDVGRVIQSAAGYEILRYGAKRDIFNVKLNERVDSVLNSWLGVEFNVNEVRAALHFAVIHMLRGVRTAQRVAPDKVDVLKYLVDDLVEVAKQWMR